MSSIIYSIIEPQNMLVILVALAAFATILTIAMPMFQQDELANRMKSAVTERDQIRARERARLAQEKNKKTLKHSNEGAMKDLVDKLNLRKALADESTFSNLTMAGYRKKSHINTFLFFRFVLPIIMLVFGAIYVFGFWETQHTFFMKLAITFGVAAFGFYLPNMFVKSKVSKRQLSIKRAWPDALDLMLICVESGMSLEAAFRKVAIEIGIQSPELAEELMLTTAELSYLQERRKGFENLATRVGLDGVKNVTMALIQAERYGTPLSTALRTLSQESRDTRMQEAEKKAASLPPKLTVPMIVFFLPVLFCVIMGPAFIQIFAD